MKCYIKNIKWYFLLFASFVLAQQPISYSVKNGLPSNHIYDVLQDTNGFTWIATNRGLVKFDGHEFKVFTHKNGLPNNDVWKLRLDAKGRLWFFSKSNLQGFVKKDSIHVFPTLGNNVISPENIFAYPDGLTMDQQKEKFINGKLSKNDSYQDIFKYKSFAGKRYYNIQYNKLCFVVHKNKVSLHDDKLKMLNEAKTKEPIKAFSILLNYFPDETFSVKTNNCFFLTNAKTHQVNAFMFKDLGFSENQNILIKKIGNEYQVSGKNLLYIIDEQFNIKERIELDYNIEQNFSLRDTKGNIWMWNIKNGLYLLTKNQIKTDYFLNERKITVVGEMADEIIAASETQEDFCFYFDGAKFLSHPFVKNNGEIFIPYHIVNEKEEDYLVCQNKIFMSKNGSWDFLDTTLSDYYQYGAKDVLRHNGVHYFITSTFISSEKEDKFYATGLTDLEEWDNHILVGSSSGLKVYENDSLKTFLPKDSLLNFPISRLVKGKNNLWIGTDGRGIFGLKNNQIHHIQETEDLSISQIIEDKGFLWIGTNNGVKKLKIENGISQSKIVNNYYESDGLPQNNTNDIYLKDNKLWVATDDGIAVLSTKKNILNNSADLYFKFPKDTLTVTPKENRSFSVSFGAINYGNQDNLHFFYRLLPDNDTWQNIDTRSISFNELSAGNYTLQIKSIDQHFKENYANLTLKIMPKWYETKTAWLIFILSGFIVVGLLSWLIVYIFQRRKNKRLEQKRRFQALQLQALRSQMNPHFVHNSLNAIQYYIQLNDVDKSEYYLTKFSELIRLFFEYSREKDISIRKEIDMLKRYLDIEKLRFEDKIDYEIHVDENLDTDEQKIPTMILQPLVENAVNHGLFHKKTEGKVDLYFDLLDQNKYRVKIIDDGIGVKKAKEIYQNSVKNYRSRSSMVLEERLKLLNKSKEWEVQYNVSSTSEGKNTGTHIVITFENLTI